jgi:hypothetical protein
VGGGNRREVQLVGGCKHVVDVSDNVDKSGGTGDGSTGTTGGDDIRGVQLGGGCKHAVVVCDDREETGVSSDGSTGTPKRKRIF